MKEEMSIHNMTLVPFPVFVIVVIVAVILAIVLLTSGRRGRR
jgi:hypothetical protein